MEIWQNHGSDQEVFESILDFVQSCSNTVNLIKNGRDNILLKSAVFDDKVVAEIESERNTWRLIYALYQVSDISYSWSIQQSFTLLIGNNKTVESCAYTF